MSRRFPRLSPRVPLLLVFAATSVGAYTHFVHYRRELGYQQPVVEKFDVSALLDRTVYFFVDKNGPKLAPNDSYEALVSHVRQALAVWDAVPTSTLRVAYGGLTEGLADSSGPGGEILFDELPPGVIGLGGPVTRGDPQAGFVPIVRSQVILANDLTLGNRPRQSFSELFFNSLVHEIGHALGLQHTLASSAMSTDITRATSRAHPLGADDIAGFSALYPAPRFFETYGTITGRVLTTSGDAVHLASVVALSDGGTVVSAMTAPDGTYRMEGVLPGPYQLYVHPLPPSTQEGLGPANLVMPTSDDGASIPASPPFKTVFLGGTTHPGQSPAVAVRAAAITANIDFQVSPSGEPNLYGVTTYSFPGNSAPGVHPAFLNESQEAGFVLAYGTGLAENLGSLTIEVLGSELNARQPRLYGDSERWVRIDFDVNPIARVGAKHLLFRLPGDDIYLLPSGVQLTSEPAPVISWIEQSAGQEGVWSVRGVNFDPFSAVYFDGLPATIVDINAEGDEILVTPPPGPPGHRAIVTVYNPDGQSSALTLPDGNVIFPYTSANGGAASLTMSPGYVRVNTDRVLDISGQAVEFVPGATVVGFGTSDIVTREVDVLSPTHLRAVVTVLRESEPDDHLVSITSGLSVMILTQRLHTGDPDISEETGPFIRYDGLVNSATMTPDLSPGVLASLFGKNLAAATGAVPVTVTLDGHAASLFAVTSEQINLQVPPSVEPGVVELRVQVGDQASEPMLVPLGRVSPGVFAAARADNTFVQGSNPAQPGESLSLLVTGLGPVASTRFDALPEPIQVLLGEIRLKPEAIEPVDGMPGLYRVRFSLPEGLTGSSRVCVLVDGHRSNAIELPIGR